MCRKYKEKDCWAEFQVHLKNICVKIQIFGFGGGVEETKFQLLSPVKKYISREDREVFTRSPQNNNVYNQYFTNFDLTIFISFYTGLIVVIFLPYLQANI